jgi:hypothetical protein
MFEKWPDTVGTGELKSLDSTQLAGDSGRHHINLTCYGYGDGVIPA